MTTTQQEVSSGFLSTDHPATCSSLRLLFPPPLSTFPLPTEGKAAKQPLSGVRGENCSHFVA